MSFAATYSAATASMVVSPATTGTSCIGPQAVGVIAPENDPVPVAPAAPAKSVSSAAARMPPITSPGRSFICPPGGQPARLARAEIAAALYPESDEIERGIFRGGYRIV